MKKEVVAIILAVVVGLFTVVGGIGGFIYVSLFSIALVMAILLTYHIDVFLDPWDRAGNEFGNWDNLYGPVSCGSAHFDSENEDRSLLTFLSKGGMLQGIIIILSQYSTEIIPVAFNL